VLHADLHAAVVEPLRVARASTAPTEADAAVVDQVEVDEPQRFAQRAGVVEAERGGVPGRCGRRRTLLVEAGHVATAALPRLNSLRYESTAPAR
jgi:hypothetical protein